MASGVPSESTSYEGWPTSQLIERIKELESQLPIQPHTEQLRTSPSKAKNPPKPPRPFHFDKYPTRYVAIKYAYLGWHFSGLTISDPKIPTVESELFKALQKVKLIQSPETCKYSRCGRTDAGVSAMGQVSAMIVRSNVNPEDRLEHGGRGYSLDDNGQSKGGELDYVHILNRVLPSTIRVLAWAAVSETFDARFSCRGRYYRYFFTDLHRGLDVSAMNKAAGYFIGEHDFRNFCKLDVQKQITNFRRRIYVAQIIPYGSIQGNANSGMWMLELRGTAFLWHQVRCMMAILFLVGQGLEEPEIVRDLLDIKKFPTKPEYEMAYDVPLVLYDCQFDDIEWQYPEESSRSQQSLLQDCFAMWHEHTLQATLAELLCTSAGRQKEILPGNIDDKICVCTGSGVRKPSVMYQKVAKRKRQVSFEAMNERYRKTAKYESQQRKMEAKAKLQHLD